MAKVPREGGQTEEKLAESAGSHRASAYTELGLSPGSR